MDIYSLFTSNINAGGYKLSEMLRKIDVMWVNNSLTNEQRDKLYEQARDKANPTDSMAPFLDRLSAVELRVKKLEERIETLSGDTSVNPGEETTADWVQPTGAHDAYNVGDRVTFEGYIYESIISGNVWSPKDYPQGWTKIKEVTDADSQL